uniref:Uncharacterized protein n=1 Tax=Aegilops tauschii TaxID=37682 RepID=N1QXN5_AEGTA
MAMPLPNYGHGTLLSTVTFVQQSTAAFAAVSYSDSSGGPGDNNNSYARTSYHITPFNHSRVATINVVAVAKLEKNKGIFSALDEYTTSEKGDGGSGEGDGVDGRALEGIPTLLAESFSFVVVSPPAVHEVGPNFDGSARELERDWWIWAREDEGVVAGTEPNPPYCEDYWGKDKTVMLISTWGSCYVVLSFNNQQHKLWPKVSNVMNLGRRSTMSHRPPHTNIMWNMRIDTFKKFKAKRAHDGPSA